MLHLNLTSFILLLLFFFFGRRTRTEIRFLYERGTSEGLLCSAAITAIIGQEIRDCDSPPRNYHVSTGGNWRPNKSVSQCINGGDAMRGPLFFFFFFCILGRGLQLVIVAFKNQRFPFHLQRDIQNANERRKPVSDASK